MDYRLEVFRRVAEQQSISGAARVLRISQPAVTQHVRLLEETYRSALFVRSRSGVALTEAGAVLLEHARKVAELDEEVLERLQHPDKTLGGRIRIGASTTITQYYLPEALAAFKRRHEAVEVEILEGNSEAVIGALLGRKVDLGLIESPCRRRDLRVSSFFEDEIVVIAGADDPLAKKQSVTVREMSGRAFVSREPGSGTRQAFESALQAHKVKVRTLRIVQELPSTEAIKRAVAAGMGLGYASRISVADEVKSGSLVVLPMRRLKIRRPFSTILPLGPDPVGLRQVFLQFLR